MYLVRGGRDRFTKLAKVRCSLAIIVSGKICEKILKLLRVATQAFKIRCSTKWLVQPGQVSDKCLNALLALLECDKDRSLSRIQKEGSKKHKAQERESTGERGRAHKMWKCNTPPGGWEHRSVSSSARGNYCAIRLFRNRAGARS